MPLKDRFRRAIGRTDTRSSSSSSTSTTAAPTATATPQSQTPGSMTPVPSNPPPITLTKTNTSSRLSKTLTWTSRKNKREDKIEKWEKFDQQEWREPSGRYSKGRKSKQHQDLLRAFEWNFNGRASLEGRRSGSLFSGVSPGTSRMNSVVGEHGVRKRSSVGAGPLSREVSRREGSVIGDRTVDTVSEE